MSETKKEKPCNGIVGHEVIKLIKQDYETLVGREECLTKQLNDLQKENAQLKEEIIKECQEHQEAMKIEGLQQQLAEKDEEIKLLRKSQSATFNSLMETDKELERLQNEFNYRNKIIRQQVCEEIRAFFDVNPDTVEWDHLNEILNQVEGGDG